MSKATTAYAALGLSSLGFPGISFAKSKIKVGYIPILDHLTLAVSHARDRKVFKHIELQPILFRSWYSLAGALQAGVIDAGFLLSNFAMERFASGIDIRSILVAHRNGSGVVVGSDSGINSAKQLNGKKVAIPAKISTHTALLDSYLRKEGLSIKDVITKTISPSNMIKAMKAGKIDAYIVAEPFCAQAEMDGIGKILVLSKDILAEHICCVVVARKELIDSNPRGVQELTDSLIRSGQIIEQDKIQNNSQDITAIGSTYLKHDKHIIHQAIQNPLDRVTYTDLMPKKSDYQEILNISRQAGIIKSIDLDSFIDDRFSKKHFTIS